MALFRNPLGYAGYPPNPQTATTVNSTVRAATATEAGAGTVVDAYISPATKGVGNSTGTPPAAGSIGEQIRSTVASASAVASLTTAVTNVTSISLTPGIWDVSGVVNYTGMTTATYQQASISTTTGTLGTAGDNLVASVYVSTTAGDFSNVIPAYRLSLTTTTTVYLVAEGTYSAGTGKLYGRISATRVA